MFTSSRQARSIRFESFSFSFDLRKERVTNPDKMGTPNVGSKCKLVLLRSIRVAIGDLLDIGKRVFHCRGIHLLSVLPRPGASHKTDPAFCILAFCSSVR